MCRQAAALGHQFCGPLSRQLGYGFRVDGFWPAFWGALVVSIVHDILSTVLGS